MSLIDRLFWSLDDRLKKIELITSTQLPSPSELSVLMAWLDLTLERKPMIWMYCINLYKWTTEIHYWLWFNHEKAISDGQILQYIKDNQELIQLIPKWNKDEEKENQAKRIYKKKTLTTKKK